MADQLAMHFGQVFQNQVVQYLVVFGQSRQIGQVDVSQFELLEHTHQQPEGHVLLTMVQQGRRDEVEALDVTYLWVVDAETAQHLSQHVDALAPLPVELLARVGAQ